MRKLLFLTLLVLVLAPVTRAQGAGDYNKVEVYGGYSHGRFEATSGKQTVTEGPNTFTFDPCTPDGAAALGSNLQRLFCARRGFNGFDASVTFNVTRYFGIKGNVTGHFKSDTFADTFGTGAGSHTDTNNTKERLYNFLVGVQIKDNSKAARFKPFAHALVGLAHYSDREVQTSTGPFNFTLNDKMTAFAMKLGGGIDVRLSPRVDLRLIELDYNPVFGRDRNVPGNADFNLAVAGRTAHNFTIGVGIVIH